ncbi:type II secretion system F family protein [Sulfurospirillum sp. 1307]
MKYYEITSMFKGKKVFKTIKAPNKNDALAMAKSKASGVVISVKETSAPVEDQLANLKDNILGSFTKKSIKMKDLIAAIRQLAVMTNAGISIHDSIKEVKEATVDKSLKEIFAQIDDDLNSGLSLTEAMMSFRYELGDVTIAMVLLMALGIFMPMWDMAQAVKN